MERRRRTIQGRLQLITSAGREADGQRMLQHAPTPGEALLDAYAQAVIYYFPTADLLFLRQRI